MKHVERKWTGYITSVGRKTVWAAMQETTPGSSLKELWPFRRNKFHREDRDWLKEGVPLVLRLGRNGNGKRVCTITVSKRTWTREEIHRAEAQADSLRETFGCLVSD